MPRPVLLFALTLLTLVAFAANSVLGRIALSAGDTGAWSYTLIRIMSGALILLCVTGARRSLKEGTWGGAVSILIYAVFFSYAYLMLATGTGALILFASVQMTMLGWGFFRGERLSLFQWTGFIFAIGGLVYLLSPSLEAPSVLGSVFMALSGMGWGIYSIIGKGAGSPTARTSGNLFKAAFILGVLSIPILAYMPETLPTSKGWMLAIASGTITTGLGYALWYHVLRDISVSRAGIAQLSVPALAAIGGVIFVSEPLTYKFVVASFIILFGVAVATLIRPTTPR